MIVTDALCVGEEDGSDLEWHEMYGSPSRKLYLLYVKLWIRIGYQDSPTVLQ